MTFQRRGGRKLIIGPDNNNDWTPRPRIDNTLVKALARAFRWRRLLESGKFTTLTELAAAEKINPSYLSRILRLTLLAPEIVEAILDGRQSVEMSMAVLLRPFPVEWEEQLERWGYPRNDVQATDSRSRTSRSNARTGCVSQVKMC
jgi:hypothetical protein